MERMGWVCRVHEQRFCLLIYSAFAQSRPTTPWKGNAKDQRNIKFRGKHRKVVHLSGGKGNTST